MSLRVFISYGHEDLALAEGVQQGLATRGMKAFLASRNVAPGESFEVAIRRELRKADLVLLLWSEDSENSTYVGAEIGLSNEYGKLVIPIMLKPGLPAPPLVGDARYIRAWDVSDMTDLVAFLEERKKKKELANLVLVLGVVALAASILGNLLPPLEEEDSTGNNSDALPASGQDQ